VEVFEPVKGDMEELRDAREDVVAMVVEQAVFTMLRSCVWLTDTEGSRNGWLPNL
jgi:hypothetical protein